MHRYPLLVLLLGACAGIGAGEDAFRTIALSELAIEGSWPAHTDEAPAWRLSAERGAYAVLDGPGEAVVGWTGGEWEEPRDADDSRQRGRLSLRAPAGAAPSGVLAVPHGKGMALLRFTAPAGDGGEPARTTFWRDRERRDRQLQARGIAGTAWFRWRADAARAELDAAAVAPGELPWRNPATLDDTLDLFNGGTALAENLQLDAQLNVPAGGAETVAIAGIEGISVAALDWTPLIKDLHPDADPLARLVPFDQHAVFFASFAAMTAALDRIDGLATPALHAVGDRAEDALTRERYQRQLCLEMSELSRLFGPQVVASVAITGSDPYLRMGADVALLFEPKQREALVAFIAAKHAAAATGAVRAVKGTAGAVAWTGVVDDARTVSSYLALVGDAVVVTNSLAQLERLAATAAGGKALAGEPEYAFFRDRYRRGGDETALIVLTDATIRRWCSPAWRLGDSRRLRAAAALSRLRAAQVDGVEPADVPAELGTVDFTPDGPRSARFGSLAFLTPIAEAVPVRCTQAEADAYKRFHDGYQGRWRGWFDPIALRLAVHADGGVDGDLTVMPLIAGSEYRTLIELAGKAKLAPGSGDPHPGELLHWALAIDRSSRPLQEAGQMVVMQAPAIGIDPLGWLGPGVSAFVDADPVWDEWLAAGTGSEFLQANLGRLPVALTAEVADPLKLALFLTAARGFADQSAPGLTRWENRVHREQAYVRVAAAGGGLDYALFYAALPDRLVLTFNEDLLERVIDRRIDAAAGAAPLAWLGEQLALRADARALPALDALDGGGGPTTALQRRAWANLPILNEWKRRFPDEDPVAVHERLWHARLVCPGGGAYVWNERWRTMESTAFGHPGEPKRPEALPLLRGIAGGEFGIGFEHDGLRARARLAAPAPAAPAP